MPGSANGAPDSCRTASCSSPASGRRWSCCSVPWPWSCSSRSPTPPAFCSAGRARGLRRSPCAPRSAPVAGRSLGRCSPRASCSLWRAASGASCWPTGRWTSSRRRARGISPRLRRCGSICRCSRPRSPSRSRQGSRSASCPRSKPVATICAARCKRAIAASEASASGHERFSSAPRSRCRWSSWRVRCCSSSAFPLSGASTPGSIPRGCGWSSCRCRPRSTGRRSRRRCSRRRCGSGWPRCRVSARSPRPRARRSSAG